MLEHMRFAHEMDNGSNKTYVNAAEVNGCFKQHNESNSIEDVNMREDDVVISGIDENGSSNDTTNMEVVFETSDENIVIYETVECKSNFNENDGEMTSTTQNKNSEKNSYDSTITDEKINEIIITSEFDGTEEQKNNKQVDNEEIIVRAEEITESAPVNVKIVKVRSLFYINKLKIIILFVYITQFF